MPPTRGLTIAFDPASWYYDGSTLYNAKALYRDLGGKHKGTMVYGSFSVLGDYGTGLNGSGKLTFQEMLELETKATRHHLAAAVKTTRHLYVAPYFADSSGYWDKAKAASFLPLTQLAESNYPNPHPVSLTG